MMYAIQLLCAFGAGISIVCARSFNAYLANKIGAIESSFFNYFTGFITSIIFLVCFSFSSYQTFFKFDELPNYWMLLGGIIGVANIIILNIVVNKIPPLQLTLVIFIAQLLSGMLLDLFLYNIFSIQKLIGCLIVVVGLLHYQYVLRKEQTLRL